MMRTDPQPRLLVLFVALAAALATAIPALAQGQETVDPRTAAPGPLSIVATVDRTTTSVVEPVRLTIEVRSLPGSEVTLDPAPRLGQGLGDFTVAAVRHDPPRAEQGVIVDRWVVELEPFLPGPAAIPPIRATINTHSASATASGDGPLASSEAIEIRVTSVLESGAAFEPGQIRAPLDPVAAAPAPRPGWMIPAAASIFLVGGTAAGWLAIRPTPAKLVRRRFAPLVSRARDLASASASSSISEDASRASAAAALLRDLAATVAGVRGQSATAGEYAAAVDLDRAGIPREQAMAIERLLGWSERSVYGGPGEPPPPIPDLPLIVDRLRSRAVIDARVPRTAIGPTSIPAPSPVSVGGTAA